MFTPEDYLRILEMICIDTNNFTSEDYEQGSTYDFDIYMRKNYPDETYDYRYGASKLVIIPDNADFVIKIPFDGIYDEDREAEYGDGYWEFEAAPFTSTNYCESEAIFFERAEEAKIDFAFAETRRIGYAFGRPIYTQRKVTNFYDRPHYVTEEKLERINRFSDNNRKLMCRCGGLPTEWILDFIEYYSFTMLQRLIDFIYNEHISDLYETNVGYIDDIPVINDYSGYYDF